MKRLRKFLRRASKNDTRTVYALKCDIRKFFASVDHEILKGLLRKRIASVGMMQLIEGIIDSFQVAPDVGMPLGNLTSQLFANVYLHELDWFVKQELGIEYYLRYCDDFVLLTDSPESCEELAGQIDTFLLNRLHIQLHPNKVHIRTWNQGVDFLGYISLPHATVLRPSTEHRALRNANIDNASSYLGLCKYADAYFIEKMIAILLEDKYEQRFQNNKQNKPVRFQGYLHSRQTQNRHQGDFVGFDFSLSLQATPVPP